jgi:hypothetical protein
VLQNKDEINGDLASDPSQVIKNGSSPRFPFAAKPEDHNNAGAFEIASGAQELAEPKGCVPFKQAETPSNITSMVCSIQLPFTICSILCTPSMELLISVAHGRCFIHVQTLLHPSNQGH